MLIAGFLSCLFSQAQIPDGTVAPDFTATDIGGNEFSLYNTLDAGQVVIVQYFAVWDSYAWDYYNSGVLQALFTMYGPDGTNQLVILQIESEPSNTSAQLFGPQSLTGDPASQTQGDWITSNPFIVVDSSAIAGLYDVTYLPTLFMICPDKISTQINQVETATIATALNGQICPVLTAGQDPAITQLTTQASCGSGVVDISFYLKNLGTETLSVADILIEGVSASFNHTWTGNLLPYQEELLVFDDVAAPGNTDVQVSITSTDSNSLNNSEMVPSGIHKTSPSVKLVLGLDNFPEEVSWEIRDSNGNVVHSDGDFTVSYQYFEDTLLFPSDGCYSFYLFDEGGDGLHGSQWGGYDGTCYLSGLNGYGEVIAEIVDYDGSYDFEETESPPSFLMAEFEVLTALETSNKTIVQDLMIYPNPTNGKLNFNLGKMDSRQVDLKIMDSAGQLVFNRVQGFLPSGVQNFEADLTALPVGIYIVKLSDDKTQMHSKLILTH